MINIDAPKHGTDTDADTFVYSSPQGEITYRYTIGSHGKITAIHKIQPNAAPKNIYTTGINAQQFYQQIVGKGLENMALEANGRPIDTHGSRVLLQGTAAIESHLGTYVVQENGPALGAFQMEPFTYRDIFHRGTEYDKNHGTSFMTKFQGVDAGAMVYNFRLAVQMARMKYWLLPSRLPPTNRDSMWAYYKQYYNTPLGAATKPVWDACWATWVEDIL